MANAKKHKKSKLLTCNKTSGHKTVTQLLFTSDSDLGEGEGDIDSGEEYEPSYERVRDGLEAELHCCMKCVPQELLCIVDKSTRHWVVTVEMVRTWVLALVSPSLFTFKISLILFFIVCCYCGCYHHFTPQNSSIFPLPPDNKPLQKEDKYLPRLCQHGARK